MQEVFVLRLSLVQFRVDPAGEPVHFEVSGEEFLLSDFFNSFLLHRQHEQRQLVFRVHGTNVGETVAQVTHDFDGGALVLSLFGVY